MKKMFTLILFCFVFSAFSQKSAPVAGDAASLIDLLFKDYDAVNPETKLEEIARDRTKVISLFKSYAKDYKETSKKAYPENEKILYLKSIEVFNNFNKKSKLENDEEIALNTLLGNLKDKKGTYYEKLFEHDEGQIESLIKHFKDNQNEYVYKIIKDFDKKYLNLCNNAPDNFAKNNNNLSIQKSLPFSGGDILVDGIDGLSRFLANKIKEELTLNAVQNIQEYLKNKDKNEYLYELEAILPTTVDYLKNFDADQVLKFSNDIKQYIETDFENIVDNASNLRYTPRVMRAIERYPDLDFAFEGLEILEQVSKIKSPVDYFEIISNSRNLNRWDENPNTSKYAIAQSLQLASMLAYSLTLVENGEVKFVTTDFIANYGSQEEFMYLYFGFLHQQNAKYFNLKKSDSTYFTAFVNDATQIKKGFDFLKYQIIPIVKNAERLHSQLLEIKKTNKNGEKLEYAKVHQLIVDLVSFGEEVTLSADWLMQEFNYKIEDKENISNRLKPFFSISRVANDITLDLHEKRYTSAVTKAIEIAINIKSFKGETNNTLAQIKYNFESFQSLKALSTVITIDTSLTDADKLKIWNTNKTAVEIVRLKFNDSKKLKKLSIAINTFITDFPLESWNDTIYIRKKDTLKKALEKNIMYLLDYLNKSEAKIKLTTQLDTLVADEKISADTKNYLLDKYSKYEEQAFKKYFLKENTTITEENELDDLLKAFIPELLNKESIKSNHKLVKLIHFINDVAYADTPEAYEKAIEAFVLPVGSSSLKEKAKQYYAINSFPGIMGGIEKSDGLKSVGFAGFTVPVGLYVQPWGSSEKGRTWGFFFPIIDIAAPVRLRLDSSNDTQTLPDFEFKDIFSPGAYIVFGFGKSPFAINLGFQYGPKLRDIPTADTSTFTAIESYRIGLGFTIDIPLLTLGSKYKN